MTAAVALYRRSSRFRKEITPQTIARKAAVTLVMIVALSMSNWLWSSRSSLLSPFSFALRDSFSACAFSVRVCESGRSGLLKGPNQKWHMAMARVVSPNMTPMVHMVFCFIGLVVRGWWLVVGGWWLVNYQPILCR